MANRAVTLHWNGKNSDFRTPREREAPLEHLATADGKNRFVFGDNLAGLRSLKEAHAEKVTLAYLDPPFLTGRVHEAIARKKMPTRIARTTRAAFDDRWEDRAAYLEALAPRISLCRDLLAPHGSIVVHVDPKTSHYVKVLMDEIFGAEAFASEIIWRYRRWPSKTPNFQRVHDVLLRYRKDPTVKPRWNTPYEPLAASTLAVWGKTKQRAVFDGKGNRLKSTATDEETRGVPMGDVWDIGVLAPISKERTGYPSQKPEALLERLVAALTDPGEILLDPYAGSGTSLVVAHRMGRSFFGADQSEVSREIALDRLKRGGADLAHVPESRTSLPR